MTQEEQEPVHLSTGDILPWAFRGHWLRSRVSRCSHWDSKLNININAASLAPRAAEASDIR